MPKTCIVCGQLANSKEHVFPAAFGGKVVNKGIYCSKHNNDFGHHVDALIKSMDFINAEIGVVPDGKSSTRAVIVASGGKEYYYSNREFSPKSPDDIDENSVGKVVNLEFGSKKQAEDWIKRQEKNGFSIERKGSLEVRNKLAVDGINIQMTLGNDEFKRAVAYVAMTFLAHINPKLARSIACEHIKNILIGNGVVEEIVWLEVPSSLEKLPINPFCLGHTIAFGLDKSTNNLLAIISFFGAINYAVKVCTMDDNNDMSMITIHVDPKAKSAKDSFLFVENQSKKLELSSLEQSFSYLQDIRSGKAPNPIEELMRLIGRMKDREFCDDFLSKFNVFDSSIDPRDRILHIINQYHKQIVFNRLKRIFHECAEEITQIQFIYDAIFSADDSTDLGVAKLGEHVLDLCVNIVVFEIFSIQKNDHLNHELLIDAINKGCVNTFKMVIEQFLKPH